MFLTKMPINPRRRGAQRLLSSPQAMHAAVLAGFPDARPTEDGRVLWRVDSYQPHRAVLYTVSPDKPDFTHLVEQAGWPTTTAWDARVYDGLLDSLRAGQRWRFRLTANPVHSARRAEWAETKPLAHVTVTQQQQWLVERADRLGFTIPVGRARGDEKPEPDVAVVDRTVRRFARDGARVTVAMATFEGHLEVVDPLVLRRSLTFGIGRAKSYGCGLLTLAPLPTNGIP